MTKKCGKCKEIKKISEFNKKGKSYQYLCKDCNKFNLKQHYKNNKPKYLVKNKLRKKKCIKWWKEFKSQFICTRCGESHQACIDFHHINKNNKKYNIAHMVGRGLSIERIKIELKKCIVLCANCHRKEHWKD